MFAMSPVGVRDRVVASGVVTTEKSSKKRNVLAADDNLRRAKEVAAVLTGLVDLWKIKAICAESMSFPRNASAAAKMAMTWGVVATLSSMKSIPVVQASPQEIKANLCGRRDASKEDIQGKVIEVHEELPGFLQDIAPSNRNHAYDAAAAYMASASCELISTLRGMVT